MPPNGVTYFHRPTGRCCDGRVIIDFIAAAQDLGLPLVPPYFGVNGSEKFEYGGNFSVTGANAMENDFFERAGILVTWKDYSLARQLQWFKQFLLEHRVSTKPVMVAGLFPFGCTSKIMTMFKTEDENRYDSKTGCIKWVNDFAEHHNDLLKIQLSRLKQLHPHANIIYADYYTSAIPAYMFPEEFGFNVTLVACCGSGGEYNFDSAAVCGQAGSTLCDDPSSYVSWDGVHMTEAANRVMAEGLLKGSSLCNCAAGSVLPPPTSFNYKDALVYQCNFSCLLWSGGGGQYNFSPDIVCGNEAFKLYTF